MMCSMFSRTWRMKDVFSSPILFPYADTNLYCLCCCCCLLLWIHTVSTPPLMLVKQCWGARNHYVERQQDHVSRLLPGDTDRQSLKGWRQGVKAKKNNNNSRRYTREKDRLRHPLSGGSEAGSLTLFSLPTISHSFPGKLQLFLRKKGIITTFSPRDCLPSHFFIRLWGKIRSGTFCSSFNSLTAGDPLLSLLPSCLPTLFSSLCRSLISYVAVWQTQRHCRCFFLPTLASRSVLKVSK